MQNPKSTGGESVMLDKGLQIEEVVHPILLPTFMKLYILLAEPRKLWKEVSADYLFICNKRILKIIRKN